ncbi:MAG TPA: AraC family transcriptional regulator [Alphaproteobacteria bacterium]|nr:AraC family transcriptional regulator [Alphaproteobacteria bacterium]
MAVDQSEVSIPAPDTVVPWRFSAGDEFEIPGGRGRLERLAFDSGIVLYRTEIEVFDACVITVHNRLSGPWIGTSTHVVGRSVLQPPDGRMFEISPEQSLILRVDRDGSRFHLDGGQVVRHVGVSTTMPALERRLGGVLPQALRAFAAEVDDAVIVQPIGTTGRMRGLAASLFSPQVDGPLGRLMLEGIATQILSGMVGAICSPKDAAAADLAPWERLALADIVEHIQSDPAAPLPLPELAADMGLSEHRLERIFRDVLGRSPADFIRGERLSEAQRLLDKGDLPIKQVAARVGYAHVSNFTRAYRAHFGETPARTLRRSLDARGPE